jgi:(p)ppGpp synthase/HD superfamily hydrolase
MTNPITNPGLLILDACHFASDAHKGQFRKYNRDPYIVHPKAVANWVALATNNDPETVAAAWLHDVVEDTEYTLRDIRVTFGDTVAMLVSCVTNVTTHDDGNREARKAKERAHLRKADPRAKTIKLADIIDNVPSIVQFDPGFARTYVREKWLALSSLREGHFGLWHQADLLLADCARELELDFKALDQERYNNDVCNAIDDVFEQGF